MKKTILFIFTMWLLTGPAFARQLVLSKEKKNVNQLHAEILNAFPAFRGTPLPDGTYRDSPLRVEETPTEIRLVLPEGANESAVMNVVDAHVPDPNWPPEPPAKRSARNKLKALGFTDAEISFLLG